MFKVYKIKSSLLGLKRSSTLTISILMTTLLAGCATTTNKPRPFEPQDPLEPINRVSFVFNQQVDRFVLKPLAIGYTKVTPQFVRTGVNNFYWNLVEITTTANNILQVEPKAAATSFGRLAINSTIGIVGIFDVASHMGLQRDENDFGITLAKWGFTSSPYFVIPFLGPSNFRDGIGLGVDYELFSIYPYIQSVKARNILLGLDYVRIRANFLDNEDVLNVAALDKYTLLRDAYIQRRSMQMEAHGAHWDQAKYYDMSNTDLAGEDTEWAITGSLVTMPEEEPGHAKKANNKQNPTAPTAAQAATDANQTVSSADTTTTDPSQAVASANKAANDPSQTVASTDTATMDTSQAVTSASQAAPSLPTTNQ